MRLLYLSFIVTVFSCANSKQESLREAYQYQYSHGFVITQNTDNKKLNNEYVKVDRVRAKKGTET